MVEKWRVQCSYWLAVARVMEQRGRLLVTSALLLCVGGSQVYSQSHPILEQLADRVVQQYQTASCEQLAAQRPVEPTGLTQTRRRFSTFPAQPPQPAAQSRQPPLSEAEQQFIPAMHQDQQLREAFLNRVAAPIANKLFECGIIPW
jgi:hypothetical protein